jgi:hypothetical protein
VITPRCTSSKVSSFCSLKTCVSPKHTVTWWRGDKCEGSVRTPYTGRQDGKANLNFAANLRRRQWRARLRAEGKDSGSYTHTERERAECEPGDHGVSEETSSEILYVGFRIAWRWPQAEALTR